MHACGKCTTDNQGQTVTSQLDICTSCAILMWKVRSACNSWVLSMTAVPPWLRWRPTPTNALLARPQRRLRNMPEEGGKGGKGGKTIMHENPQKYISTGVPTLQYFEKVIFLLLWGGEGLVEVGIDWTTLHWVTTLTAGEEKEKTQTDSKLINIGWLHHQPYISLPASFPGHSQIISCSSQWSWEWPENETIASKLAQQTT